MKKNNKIIITILMILITITLSACANNTYKNYVGNKYSGTDPWGNNLSITIRTIDDKKMTWTFTDVIGESEKPIIITDEPMNDIKDGIVNFKVSGKDISNEKMSFTYSGTLTLKDDKITIKYDSGQVIENAEEGGSSSYQVAALNDSEKTVTLNKVDTSK